MMANFRNSPGFSVSAAGTRGALLLGDSCSLSSPVVIPASSSRLAAWRHRVCHRSIAFPRYQMCHTVHRCVHVEHRRCTIAHQKSYKSHDFVKNDHLTIKSFMKPLLNERKSNVDLDSLDITSVSLLGCPFMPKQGPRSLVQVIPV